MPYQQDYRPRKSGISHFRSSHQEYSRRRTLAIVLPGAGKAGPQKQSS